MNSSDKLHMTINSIIGFVSTVIGLIGLGIAPSLIFKFLAGIFLLIGIVFLAKVMKRFIHCPSPYHPWTSVIPPDFVGRKDLLRQLNDALKNGESLSLIGEQRIGKTSLLKTWQQQLVTTERVVVFIDGLKVAPSEFVHAVTQREVPDNPDKAADVLQQWAREMALPPLLLVDESECFLENLPRRFFERLRGMLDQIVVVLATSREMNQIFADLGQTSPLSLRILHLPLLDAPSRDSLIARGKFNVLQIELIKEWAGEHPFYVQLLGQCLIEARQNSQSVETALRHFQTNAAARFKKLWETLSETERQSLLAANQSVLKRRSLIERGLVTEDGQLFGKVLKEWLKEISTTNE